MLPLITVLNLGFLLSFGLGLHPSAFAHSEFFDDPSGSEAFQGSVASPQDKNYESFTEASDSKKRQALQLELRGDRTAHTVAPHLPKRASGFHLIRPSELPSEVTLIEGSYEDGSPMLEVEAQGRRYRVFFGGWVHAEVAGAKIHRALGFHTRSVEAVDRLRIRMGKKDPEDFLRYWARARNVVYYHKHIGSPEKDSNGTFVEARRVMIELLPQGLKTEEVWSFDETQAFEKRPEFRALTAIEAWLQNNDLTEHRNHLLRTVARDRKTVSTLLLRGFRYGFGNSLTLSTPNLLGTEVIANSSQVRSALQRGQSVQAQLRFVPYGKYREVLSRTTLADLREGTVRIASLSEQDLITIFSESLYPNSVSRLLAAKLIRRANQLITTLQPVGGDGVRLQSLPGADPEKISDGKYIRDGEILEDYPGFESDLTYDSREHLMVTVGRSLEGVFNAVIEEMLRNFPDKLLQPNITPEGSKFSYGPGWDFRAKRKVDANQHPTGLHDLYTVRDEMRFSLSFGVGLDLILGTPIWANISPSYEWTWVYQAVAPSEEAARRHPWLIPFRIIWEGDYSNLKSGESYGVQKTISVAAMAGGGIRAMPKTFRVGAYAAAGAERLSSLQVHRRGNDYVIAQDSGEQIFAASKLYLQYIRKWLRIPLARLFAGKGRDRGKIYQIPGNRLTPESRAELQNALLSADPSGLERYFPPTHRNSTYELKQMKLSLLVLNATLTGADSDQTLTPPKDSKDGKKRYVHISREIRNFEHSLSTGRESQVCRFAGVVEYEDEDRTQVKDRYLQAICAIKDAETSIDELRHYVSIAFKSVGNVFDVDKAMTGIRHKDLGRGQVKVWMRLFNDQLGPLFAMSDEDWRKRYPTRKMRPTDSFEGVPDPRAYPPDVEFSVRMQAVLRGKTDAEKMDLLVALLSENRLENVHRPQLLAKFSNFLVKVETTTDTLATVSNPGLVFEYGNKVKSPARDYLDQIEPLNSSNYFIEY